MYRILEMWFISFLKSGSMRQGPSNNQSNNRRGRGRGHHHHNNKRHTNHNSGHRNQNFDSNGPQGRIRGNAKQIYEKYLQLAKDAISSGDRVLAESLFQHADHYGRVAAVFIPKPKPEIEEAPEVVDVEETTTTEAVVVEPAEVAVEAVSVEIENGDTAEPVVEEEKPKPKPKRRTPVRRAARKRIEENTPKLGGGSNAVPDFLARPVEVESDTVAEEPAAEVEEKPKRRAPRRAATPRKTTTPRTRRKKADAEPVADGSEQEAS